MKKIVQNPHLIFSVDSPRYQVTEPYTQESAIQKLRELTPHNVYATRGKFGGVEEPSIFVSYPTPEQIKLAHELSNKTGQMSLVESNGNEHRHIVFDNKGRPKYVLSSQGTTIHPSKPEDDYTEMNGTYFTHNLKFPDDDQMSSEDMARYEDKIQKSEPLQKMSQPRLRFPNFGVDPRAEENVQQISTPRQLKVYSKKVANYQLPNRKVLPNEAARGATQQDVDSAYQKHRDKMATKTAGRFNRNVVGLNQESSPSALSFRGPKSFQGNLSGAMRTKFEEPDDAHKQKIQSYEDQVKQAQDEHVRKMAHWRNNANAILDDKSKTDSERESLWRMHTHNKPVFKKPRAPSRSKVATENLWQTNPDAAKQRGRDIDSTTEHEATHGNFDVIGQKYGSKASLNARQHMLNSFDPKDMERVGNFISTRMRYDPKDPHFTEELLTHTRDILTNPRKRQKFKESLGDISEQEKQNIISKLKSGWKKAYQTSKQLRPEDVVEKSEDLLKSKNVREQRARVFGINGAPANKDQRKPQIQALSNYSERKLGAPVVPSKGKIINPQTKERAITQSRSKKPDWRSGDIESEQTTQAVAHELGHIFDLPEGMDIGTAQEWMDEGSKRAGSLKDDFGNKRSGAAKQIREEIVPMAYENPIRRRAGVPSFARPQDKSPIYGESSKVPLAWHHPPRTSLDEKKKYAVRVSDKHGRPNDLIALSQNLRPQDQQRLKDIDEGILAFHPHKGWYKQSSPNALINLRGQGRGDEAKQRLKQRFGKSEGLKKALDMGATAPKPQGPIAPQVKINPEHGKIIANAYENMKHDPNHPDVKAAYDALIGETGQQYQNLLNSGLKVSKMKAGQPNPYPTSKHLHADVDKGHMWYFPTELGFGSEDSIPHDHPMLRPTQFKDNEGQPMLANDVFRVVHDKIHHNLRNGFGPKGEHESYLEHKKTFSPLAQKALFTETAAQNNHVNWSEKNGEHNRANPSQTIFAPQKSGLLPKNITEGDWHK